MKVREIRSITDKIIEKDTYLTVDDAARLFSVRSDDGLEAIRDAADTLCQKLCGKQVSYTINLNVNFTNICDCSCLFCAFRCSEGDKSAYIIDLDELDDKLKDATANGAMEVCFQGGLYPKLQIPGLKAQNIVELYSKLMLWVKDRYPDIITHSFSPEEVDFAAYISDKSIEYTLESFKDHGLDTMPGTAAEILVDEIRKRICPRKLNTAKWVEVVKMAHRFNIPTTSTIMYGHFETNQHLAQHLNILRDIQMETGGITEFIPLPLVAVKTVLKSYVKPLRAEDRLKLLAISRLFFADLIPNIQASWVKQGVEETIESLSWGVNDIGGTLGDERITVAAGGTFGQSMEAKDLVNMICKANKQPVLRDTYYNSIMANVCLAC
ncbi:MAG: 5-amino-6-(D-ribitylamino)uracil--L-tyrosine 4-hydroxyphenyl transferase CofH [Vampirovibrionia bacterium]